MSKYMFGASFNCIVGGGDAVGGGGEGCTSLDFVSNSLGLLKYEVIADTGDTYCFRDSHELVGKDVDVGGVVVSVMVTDDDDAFVTAVIVTEPNAPVVVDRMSTQLEWLKEAIESGDSCIEAYEQVDLNLMTRENPQIADRIFRVLEEVTIINRAAGIK